MRQKKQAFGKFRRGSLRNNKDHQGEAFYSDSQGMSLQRRPTNTLKKGNFWSEKVPSFKAWLFHLRRNKRK